MLERAKEGDFVRASVRNLVYYPAGTSETEMYEKNGNIHYANKNACKHCKNRNNSYKGKYAWKEIISGIL